MTDSPLFSNMCDEIVDASLIDEGNCFRQYYCCVAWNVDIVTVKNVDSIADETSAEMIHRFVQLLTFRREKHEIVAVT